MTQDERWQKRYEEVVDFIETNKRNPSKYVGSERALLNWEKQQRKLMNAGELKEPRLSMFKELLAYAGHAMGCLSALTAFSLQK